MNKKTIKTMCPHCDKKMSIKISFNISNIDIKIKKIETKCYRGYPLEYYKYEKTRRLSHKA